MRKEKLFAPFLMLFAGAVVSIVMFRGHYETGQMLSVLIPVLIVFYVAGWFIQKQITGFVNQIKEAEEAEKAEAENEMSENEEEGEVIAKNGDLNG